MRVGRVRVDRVRGQRVLRRRHVGWCLGRRGGGDWWDVCLVRVWLSLLRWVLGLMRRSGMLRLRCGLVILYWTVLSLLLQRRLEVSSRCAGQMGCSGWRSGGSRVRGDCHGEG